MKLLYGRNYSIRPERAEALSPGQRPGLLWMQGCRPVRAKALKLSGKYIKLLPLQGALPIAIIPRALPWAKSFCPFRACCWGTSALYLFPSASDRWFRACCWRASALYLFPSAGDRWFRACWWRASGSSGRANRTGRNIL